MNTIFIVLALLCLIGMGFVVYLYIQGSKEKKRQKEYIENEKKATARNKKKESFLKKYSGKKRFQKAPSK